MITRDELVNENIRLGMENKRLTEENQNLHELVGCQRTLVDLLLEYRETLKHKITLVVNQRKEQ